MAIEERTVCDDQGRISVMENGMETVKGTSCPVDDNPYQFFAGTPDETGKKVTVESGTTVPIIITVQMVLPVGGETSGLYRFPRIGEKVLIGVEGSANYLLGYVPNTADQPFSPLKDEKGNNIADPTQAEVIDQQGQVFRYKNTAAQDTDSNKYSEIGFYKKIRE